MESPSVNRAQQRSLFKQKEQSLNFEIQSLKKHQNPTRHPNQIRSKSSLDETNSYQRKDGGTQVQFRSNLLLLDDIKFTYPSYQKQLRSINRAKSINSGEKIKQVEQFRCQIHADNAALFILKENDRKLKHKNVLEKHYTQNILVRNNQQRAQYIVQQKKLTRIKYIREQILRDDKQNHEKILQMKQQTIDQLKSYGRETHSQHSSKQPYKITSRIQTDISHNQSSPPHSLKSKRSKSTLPIHNYDEDQSQCISQLLKAKVQRVN